MGCLAATQILKLKCEPLNRLVVPLMLSGNVAYFCSTTTLGVILRKKITYENMDSLSPECSDKKIQNADLSCQEKTPHRDAC
jgi:hypothetical protein